MSGLLTGVGSAFVTETNHSSALAGVFVNQPAAVTGATVDLAGDLAPATALGGQLSTAFNAQGDLAATIAFAGDLSIAVAGATVDLSGSLAVLTDLAGVLSTYIGSPYGRGLYGKRLYSRALNYIYDLDGDVAPIVTFAGDLNIAGKVDVTGDLTPIVTFAGKLGFDVVVDGDLAPRITLAGELSLLISLAGDIAPVVELVGEIGLNIDLGGDMAPAITLSGDFTAGPLWGAKPPCTGQWSPTNLCDDPGWTKAEPDPMPWREVELCDG